MYAVSRPTIRRSPVRPALSASSRTASALYAVSRSAETAALEQPLGLRPQRRGRLERGVELGKQPHLARPAAPRRRRQRQRRRRCRCGIARGSAPARIQPPAPGSNAASISENSRISRNQLRLGGVAGAGVGGGAAAASLEDRQPLPRGSNLLRQAGGARALSCAPRRRPRTAAAALSAAAAARRRRHRLRLRRCASTPRWLTRLPTDRAQPRAAPRTRSRAASFGRGPRAATPRSRHREPRPHSRTRRTPRPRPRIVIKKHFAPSTCSIKQKHLNLPDKTDLSSGRNKKIPVPRGPS